MLKRTSNPILLGQVNYCGRVCYSEN